MPRLAQVLVLFELGASEQLCPNKDRRLHPGDTLVSKTGQGRRLPTWTRQEGMGG